MSRHNCLTSWWISATRCGASEHPMLSYLVTSVATLFFVVTGYMIIRCCCLYHRRRVNNRSRSSDSSNILAQQQQQSYHHHHHHHQHYQQAVSELELEHREIYIPGNSNFANHLALGAAVFQAHRQFSDPEHDLDHHQQQQQQQRICVIMAGEDSPSFIAQPSPLK